MLRMPLASPHLEMEIAFRMQRDLLVHVLDLGFELRAIHRWGRRHGVLLNMIRSAGRRKETAGTVQSIGQVRQGNFTGRPLLFLVFQQMS